MTTIARTSSSRPTLRQPVVAPQRRPTPTTRSNSRNVDRFETSRSSTTRTSRTAAVRGYTPTQMAYVREMVKQAKAAGVPPELPLMTALVESRMKNLNYGDRDSIGLFQQRNAWGSRADRLDPAKATRMFLYGGKQGQRGATDYKRLFGKLPPTAANLGRWCQKVQVSAFPGRYAKMYQEARRLMAAVGAR